MEIAAEFLAGLPEPHTILGLRLLPFSLGHYQLLKRFKSPFIEEEEVKISLGQITNELVFALIVCGTPCDKFKKYLDLQYCFAWPWQETLKSECRRFGRQLVRCAKKRSISIFLRRLDNLRLIFPKPQQCLGM